MEKIKKAEQNGISKGNSVLQVQKEIKAEINSYKERKIMKGIKHEHYSKDIEFIVLNDAYVKLSEMSKEFPVEINSERPDENYKPLLLKEIAAKLGYTSKTMSRKIKKLKNENKFKKTGTGKYYSTIDQQLLEKLLGCKLSIK